MLATAYGCNGLMDSAALNCKEKLESFLRQQGVPFQLQHHPLAYTAQEVAGSEHVSGESVAKVVMVEAEGRMVMLALPASHHVNLTRAAALLGAQSVRLASEEEYAAAIPGCEVGAAPPFGKLYGLPLYADESLAKNETVVFRGGTHTDTMSIKYADYERLAEPVLADFADHS